MKKYVFLIGIVAISNSIFAQTAVPKLPFYELFTSSTCPPCAPANDNLTPIFQDPINDGEFAVVKYQMSWPGTGDPYYTNEGSARKNVYSVSSVPALFVNAIKLGIAVGFAYQSPPPLYFKIATSWAFVFIKKIKKKIIRNCFIKIVRIIF